ncbi:hypothetical protein SDC9_176040 [bioreactor metagenome]|uniref:Uncharacterized protein n=1 Tax=bioreactor metagenome TaxID=1076179 RepID=A0A645GNV3_9ZZZZ
MRRIAPDAGDIAGFGFDQDPAADAAVTTGGFDFGFHDFPTGMLSATGMPPIKIMDLG